MIKEIIFTNIDYNNKLFYSIIGQKNNKYIISIFFLKGKYFI